MSALIDLTGQRFGKLYVLRRDPAYVGGSARWLTRCDCGRECSVRGYCLTEKRTSSCGCVVKKHGQWNTPEYRTWRRMKERCYNPNNAAYAHYGPRGIRVCDRWNGPDGFVAFLADMGKRPGVGYSLDRINNDGNYEPSNCRWATARQQSQNQTSTDFIEIDGERLSVSEWARRSPVSRCTIRVRIRTGWEPKAAVFTPSLRPRKNHDTDH